MGKTHKFCIVSLVTANPMIHQQKVRGNGNLLETVKPGRMGHKVGQSVGCWLISYVGAILTHLLWCQVLLGASILLLKGLLSSIQLTLMTLTTICSQ